MAKWKYQAATSSPENLQATLDEMAKQGWEIITVLVQQSDTTEPSSRGAVHVDPSTVMERERVSEYRIVGKMHADA